MEEITKSWMKAHSACSEAYVQWQEEGCEHNPIKLINRCVEIKRYEWGNWLIARVMNRKQYISYVVYAAKQTIELYEKQYPNDKRPRTAIESAKACISNDSPINRAVARAAWTAAWGASEAAMLEKILLHGIKLLQEEAHEPNT